MMRAVLIDVQNCLIQRINDADRQNIIVIFGIPVFNGCGPATAAKNRACPLVAAKFDVPFFKGLCHARQKFLCNVFMNQEFLSRIAD